jgi:hypothetical protein
MKNKQEDDRRSFLKHVLVGTAAVVGTAAIVRPGKAKSAPTVNHLEETLYYESEDFKNYYKTLRS